MGRADSHRHPTALDQELPRHLARPRPGKQLGGEKWVVLEALLESYGHRQCTGEEKVITKTFVPVAHSGQSRRDRPQLVDERLVTASQLIQRPQFCRQVARVPGGSDLEIVGGGESDLVPDGKAGCLLPHLVVPLMGRDVKALLNRRSAQLTEPVPETIAHCSFRLGNRESNQPPVPIPPPARGILAVRQTGLLVQGAQDLLTGLGCQVGSRSPLPIVEGEVTFAHQSPEARSDLARGLTACLGHREQLFGQDLPIFVGHTEYECSGRKLNGRGSCDHPLLLTEPVWSTKTP